MKKPILFTGLNSLFNFDNEWNDFFPTPNLKQTGGWLKTSEGLSVNFDLPGLKKEDVKIEVKNSLVTVSAVREVKTENSVSKKQYFYQTHIPKGVTEDSIEASLEDGVLTLKVPPPDPVNTNKIIPIK